MMSEVTFTFQGDEQDIGANARSLANWLTETESLAQADVREKSRPARPGQMGAMAEAVSVMTANGPVFSAVIAAFGTWMMERIRTRSIAVSVKCPNGATITGTARNAAEVREIERRLLRDCKR